MTLLKKVKKIKKVNKEKEDKAKKSKKGKVKNNKLRKYYHLGYKNESNDNKNYSIKDKKIMITHIK